MATRKSSKKLKRKDPGDSPITVGGGGGLTPKLRKKLTPKQRKFLQNRIYIYFDQAWYTPKPGDTSQQWNPADEITMLIVYDGVAGQPHPEADTTKTITIPCTSANGHITSIKIKGKELGVKFNRNEFLYDLPLGMYVSAVPRVMGDIKINGKPDILHGPNAYLVAENKL